MKNKGIEKLGEIIFFLCSLLSIVSIVVICYFIFKNGIPFIMKYGISDFVLGTKWKPTASPGTFGILPMILGSIYVTFGSMVIGIPIGIFTAVFMVYYCPRKLYKFLKPALNLMAGIPSIVFGFFALMVMVPIVREIWGGTGMNIITGSILLGIMVLPTIIGLSESSIRSVPKSYYQGSIALGATHERSIFKVVLPVAKSGIIASIILAIGRSIGETMAVILVIGNQARMPHGITRGVRTLTGNIVMEMAYAANEHREALIATGVVLFVFILTINILFNVAKRRMK